MHRYTKRTSVYRQSQFVGECGIIIPLPRMRQQREKNHIKGLFCPKCGVKHDFREVRYWENIGTLADVWTEKVKGA